MKASLSSNAMVWLLRLSHLLPGVNFLSGNLNIKVLRKFVLVILRTMFGQLSGYGETEHAGYAPSLSPLH